MNWRRWRRNFRRKMMFLFCNEDRKKKERLNSLLQTTRNLIKNNEIKDVRKNPVYSLIRAMSNYHLYT